MSRYIDFLEDVAGWLASRGIRQWPPGIFRRSEAYYSDSIGKGEVFLALSGGELVGTLRVLRREPIVWPDVDEDDAVYVHTLAVARTWAHQRLGGRLLDFAEQTALSVGRRYVRLDCVSDNAFMRDYYTSAGFADRGDIDARYPHPVGTIRLRRYEKQIGGAEQ